MICLLITIADPYLWLFSRNIGQITCLNCTQWAIATWFSNHMWTKIQYFKNSHDHDKVIIVNIAGSIHSCVFLVWNKSVFRTRVSYFESSVSLTKLYLNKNSLTDSDHDFPYLPQKRFCQKMVGLYPQNAWICILCLRFLEAKIRYRNYFLNTFYQCDDFNIYSIIPLQSRNQSVTVAPYYHKHNISSH